MSESYPKVLVSAIGGPNGYGIVRCLRERGGMYIMGLDSNVLCPTRKHVDEFLESPRVDDPRYVDYVRETVSEHGVDFYFPSLHAEIALIPSLRDAVSTVGPRLSPTALRMLTDKRTVYQRLAEADLLRLVPRWAPIESVDTIPVVAGAFGYPEYPICVKQMTGHGGIGLRIVAEAEWVTAAWRSYGATNWCTLSEYQTVCRSAPDVLVGCVVMEYLNGPEYSVDVLADRGRQILAVPRFRERTSNGIVISGVVQDVPAISAIMPSVTEVLGLDCFTNVQFRLDAEGRPKLIDVNPRFCGSQVMSLGAGANFPILALELIAGTLRETPAIRWGTKTARYWECEVVAP